MMIKYQDKGKIKDMVSRGFVVGPYLSG